MCVTAAVNVSLLMSMFRTCTFYRTWTDLEDRDKCLLVCDLPV